MKTKVGSSGKVLGSQGREIVSNVYNFMKEESARGCVTIPITKARERTAAATGVSIRTVSRINRELDALKVSGNVNEEKSLTTPKKTRKRAKPITELDDFDICVVRRTVYEFYITEKRLPTLQLLLIALREKINFSGSKESLRRILKDLGFRWKRAENNRRVLIEQSDIREKRITYLQLIKRFRSEKRPIVYMDESYVLSSQLSSKVWSDSSKHCIHTPISKGERIIIVHAGGNEGFVPNALAMWKASSKTGDYHDNMNSTNYLQWVTNQLLPNLKPNTVLVIDNAGYHNTQVNKAPTSNSRKDEMIAWLIEREINFEESLLKPQLYRIIQQHKPRFQQYKLDNKLQEKGHTVLRLPPYHPDLNPIEMIWADVKKYVGSRNVDFKLANVKKLCEERFAMIGEEEWKSRCDHVQTKENEYAAKEPLIDEMTETFIINVESDSDERDTEEDTDMSGIEDL